MLHIHLTLQKAERDLRIVPTLLQVADQLMPLATTTTLKPIIGALRECSRLGPLPEAERLCRQLLTTAQQETDDDLYHLAVDNALEVLYSNNGSRFLNELKETFDIPSQSVLGLTIQEFIRQKEELEDNE